MTSLKGPEAQDFSTNAKSTKIDIPESTRRLAFSVYLLVIMSMVLSYLLIKELVSYVVDTFYKKPIIQKKKKVEVNALDRIFKEVKIDPDLIEKANRAVQNKVSLLENMLKEYGVESQVVNTVTGPSITRFDTFDSL